MKCNMMKGNMNIVSIGNLLYIIEKQEDETLESFNKRIKYILDLKPKTKAEMNDAISKSLIIYNEKYLKCTYD